MTKKNKKNQNQPDQQPTPQPTAPATPLELSEEELGQVTGGAILVEVPSASTVGGGFPSVLSN